MWRRQRRHHVTRSGHRQRARRADRAHGRHARAGLRARRHYPGQRRPRRHGQVMGPGNAHVHRVAFSPDGKWLAGAAGKTIRLWNTTTLEPAGTLEKQSAAISTLAFSPSGHHLANGSAHGLVLLALSFADGGKEEWQEY